MVPPAESVSFRNVAVGLGVGLLLSAFSQFLGEGLTSLLWLYVLLIAFAIAGSGVRPVGGTLGF
ncbi:hypothetical protein NDI76_12305 [Halogeometricum sp. S1BR25-6]|uniref:Uncharacterized protein n=1 Tax=Halogeometricum salsisoli TaxID=2950536 RepID=A0ABU2GFH6_9EURY|nr:hypothetical protein [Halogeometricum sp. S1BR25-6]MDS0299525.1 hypothetical protein [Halogeometricum sp. S1BR25-6]